MRTIERGQKVLLSLHNGLQEQGIVSDFDEEWIELFPITYDGTKEVNVVQIRVSAIEARALINELKGLDITDDNKPPEGQLNYEAIYSGITNIPKNVPAKRVIPTEIKVEETDPIARAKEIARAKTNSSLSDLEAVKNHLKREDVGGITLNSYGDHLEMFGVKKHP